MFAIRLIMTAAAAILATAATADDWPGFLGPRRNGKSAETGLPQQWPAAGPRLVWRTPIGAGYAAPAISSGRLYHFSRFGDAARLTCFDARTGAELWRREHPTDFSDMLGYSNGPRATPIVDGDRVYTLGAEGMLQCVRTSDGSVVWRVPTSEDFHVVKNFFGVGSTPLVWNDLLLVQVGGSPEGGPPDVYAAQGRVQSTGSALVAFDKLTGKVRWQTGVDLASYSSPVAETVDGRELVFLLARSGLLAIDPAKGKTVATFPWRATKLESVNAATPVVVGDEVFITETYELGGALVRFSGDQFAEVWSDRDRRRDQALASHWNTPIEHEGYLYGSNGYHSAEAELRCVDWKTGEVKWSAPHRARGSALWVDGRLVVLSEEGVLRIVRATPEKYEELARWELTDDAGEPLLSYPAWPAPALADGLLYLQDEKQLVCLRLIGDR